MPARAAITVNDGKATPVAHTFNPSTEVDNSSLFEDKAGGIAIGFNSIMVRMRRPLPGNTGQASDPKGRVYRVDLNVGWPTLESTSAATGTGIPPAPTIAYVHRVNSTWLLPERGTNAERKDLRAIFANVLAHADIKKVIEDLEDYW